MKKVAGATLIGIVIVLLANLSFASIIYEQYGGPVDGSNFFCDKSAFVAQDFSVSNNTQLTNLIFNAFTNENTKPLTDIYVKIYQNNSGSPGSLLYDNHITGTFNGVVTGVHGDFTLRDYAVTLPGENLTTGTYWLALEVGPEQEDMHWSIPTYGAIGLSSYISYDNGISWGYYSHEHSFRLESNPVPIPPTVWLFGFGLTGLVGLRRFRRR
jgi:hypothetical protein